VVDEADTIFAEGWGTELGDILKPLKSKPTPVQTILVSATMAKVRRSAGLAVMHCTHVHACGFFSFKVLTCTHTRALQQPAVLRAKLNCTRHASAAQL